MDLPDAASRFKSAMSYCDDVVDIHRQVGSGLQGRRDKETTLNRAVIVMAIAGWQVAVENMVQTGIDEALRTSGNSVITPYANLVQSAIRRFSTANSQTSRQLLNSVGYDPLADWSSSQVPGRPLTLPPAQSPLQVGDALDAWVRVRHAIAHGDPVLPAEPVLQHVREWARYRQQLPSKPGLRLKDAESCTAFIRRLAQTTGDGFANTMGLSPVNWA